MIKLATPQLKKTTQTLINHVVTEMVGEEALPIVRYLQGKKNVSEFIIAEELDLEIHKTRNTLYKLLEQNIVMFKRKKDKIKGWYICYWDFNNQNIPHLADKIKEEKVKKLRERLEREKDGIFFMCRTACVRMDFETSMDFNFKCPECGEIMNEQNNERTIQFLQERITELGTRKAV